jgi:hypothetical protein
MIPPIEPADTRNLRVIMRAPEARPGWSGQPHYTPRRRDTVALSSVTVRMTDTGGHITAIADAKLTASRPTVSLASALSRMVRRLRIRAG